MRHHRKPVIGRHCMTARDDRKIRRRMANDCMRPIYCQKVCRYSSLRGYRRRKN
jgi:hypothetical protein